MADSKFWKLKTKMTVWISLLLFVTIFLFSLLFIYWLSEKLEEQMGSKALVMAQSIAENPIIVKAFYSKDPSKTIRPFIEALSKKTETVFIVVGNREGIYYSHPDQKQVGKKMLDSDNKRVFEGESYITEDQGNLGSMLFGKAPVKDSSGVVIGVVSAGFLSSDLKAMFGNNVIVLILGSIFILIAGFVGAMFIAKRIKKLIYGLEPSEISALYQQRESIIETVREGIIMIDNEGIVQCMNQKAVEIMGLPNRTYVVGNPIANTVPQTRMLEVLQTGVSELDREIEVNGRKLVMNRLPIFDEQKIIGVVASFLSKSDLDELNKNLSQVKQYMEVMRAQTHEFHNTLYTISGLIQLGAYEEVVSLIQEETEVHQDHLAILDNIKNPWLSAILAGYYNRAKEMKVEMIFDSSSYVDQYIHIQDKSGFISLIGNLIMNALEEVQKVDGDRKVRIYIENLSDRLLLEIEDNGFGIPDNCISTVFEKGYSTKPNNEKELRGYGLWKVKQVVEEFDGEIIVERGDWGGALFAITLPLKEVTKVD